MTTNRDYITYKISKAESAIAAAELLFENGFSGEALSRLYYANFHIASALLTQRKLNPKTHEGVKALFNKEFILTGIFEKEMSKFYSNLLNRRFEADYENFAIIDEVEIPDFFEKAKLFLQKAKQILELED